MKLLDLFCGAGMASDGYASDFSEIIGVDIHPQPDYPYKFIQADAMTFPLEGYDAIHASPPCQLFTRAQHLRVAQGHKSKEKIDLLTPTIERFQSLEIPWVIENVENARSIMGERAIRLCGSSFGLQVQRHRLFLSNIHLVGKPCHHERFPLDPDTHKPRPWGVYYAAGDSIPKGGRTARDAQHGMEVMGINRPIKWNSLKEGFPPAYTHWISDQIMEYYGW
jgi:DNA (cytosine-5)-methyltransferase 1